MVQINLLSISVKKKGKLKLGLKIKLGPVIFTLVAVMLAIIITWAMLGMQLSGKQKKLSRLDEQLKSLEFTLQKLDRLNKNKGQLQRKLEFMEQQLKGEILWSENLNRLSNLVPAGIWLKKMVLYSKKEDHLDKYDKLDINGSAVSLLPAEMIDLIGGFMSALEKDEVFSKQFSEIKLISSQRRTVGKNEVMDFKLFCQFR